MITSQDFIYWLRGYLAAQPDSQMKLDIERILEQVNEYSVSSITNLVSHPNTTFTYNTKQQLND